MSHNIGNITDYIRNELDSEALIEATAPKSNVPNTIGLYITVSDFKSASELRRQINEIEGVRFSISE